MTIAVAFLSPSPLEGGIMYLTKNDPKEDPWQEGDPLFGGFDAMRFPLTYDGPLPASGNDKPKKPVSKLPEIWNIRNAVHRQLTRLLATHPIFKGYDARSRALLMKIDEPQVVDGEQFYVLAQARFKLKCELEIEMHVNHDLASIFTNCGDMDNRLKTLFDALRVPTQKQEIKNYKPKDIDHYICLLANDILITALKVETIRHTSPPDDAPENHVKLNMRVRLEPHESDFVNEPFRGD